MHFGKITDTKESQVFQRFKSTDMLEVSQLFELQINQRHCDTLNNQALILTSNDSSQAAIPNDNKRSPKNRMRVTRHDLATGIIHQSRAVDKLQHGLAQGLRTRTCRVLLLISK